MSPASINKRAVVAVGGNALIKDRLRQTVQDQHQAAGEAARHIASMIARGWDVVITHGNGPQIGFILRRSELSAHQLHEVPLDVCGADTQGAIGYSLQQNLLNVFRQLGIEKQVATVICQTEVSRDDPAFRNPTKTIGGFMGSEEAANRRRNDGWVVVEDSGRGWRRLVPSPLPRRIIEAEAIRTLVEAGVVTITAGGGGIPVALDEHGDLRGVAAVIDKDLATALLATVLKADLLLITTSVEKVALDWGRPGQRWVQRMTLSEAKARLEEGHHFERGSMRPKIQAVINYLEAGGPRAIITNPENIERALEGETGTHILP